MKIEVSPNLFFCSWDVAQILMAQVPRMSITNIDHNSLVYVKMPESTKLMYMEERFSKITVCPNRVQLQPREKCACIMCLYVRIQTQIRLYAYYVSEFEI